MPIAPGQSRLVEANRILSPTSRFIAEAGFTHSLTPARNCTFDCTYGYVPTLGVYGGLKLDDMRQWGQFTTFKTNAAELLRRELRAHQGIYCSPLVDPYQLAEDTERQMPPILDAVLDAPPRAEFRTGIVDHIRAAAQSMGYGFATGPIGFGKLAA